MQIDEHIWHIIWHMITYETQGKHRKHIWTYMGQYMNIQGNTSYICWLNIIFFFFSNHMFKSSLQVCPIFRDIHLAGRKRRAKNNRTGLNRCYDYSDQHDICITMNNHNICRYHAWSMYVNKASDQLREQSHFTKVSWPKWLGSTRRSQPTAYFKRFLLGIGFTPNEDDSMTAFSVTGKRFMPL